MEQQSLPTLPPQPFPTKAVHGLLGGEGTEALVITLVGWNWLTDARKQNPDEHLPKLFGELRERYLDRPGGYTRVLRTEPLNRHQLDQAPSAVLELVDGPRDIRFAMTAATVARDETLGKKISHENTLLNVRKVTAFRADGWRVFRDLVEKIKQSEAANFRKQEEDQTGRPYQEGW